MEGVKMRIDKPLCSPGPTARGTAGTLASSHLSSEKSSPITFHRNARWPNSSWSIGPVQSRLTRLHRLPRWDLISRRSSAWLERPVWGREVVGSNPTVWTSLLLAERRWGSSTRVAPALFSSATGASVARWATPPNDGSPPHLQCNGSPAAAMRACR